jgi:apolipoprotein N-acyltransferase
MRWELYWPWLTLGNGLAKMPFGIQWYSYTGALGGSAWILVLNYLVYNAYLKRENWHWKYVLSPVVWLIVPLFISTLTYVWYEKKGDEVEIVSVQSNFESHYEKSSFPQQIMVDRCLQLAQEKLTSTTDYVILPETSFSYINLDQPMATETMSTLRDFSQLNDVFLITGLSAHRFLEKEEEIKLTTTRKRKGHDGNDEYYEAYNCAVQIDPQGNIQEYYKALYVPGAEFFPFKRILFFLKPLVDKLGGTISGYRVREKFNLFSDNAGTNIAPAICYESIFGEFITRFIQKGANVIFVMTNDGWWDNTAGYRQHADYARLRAIECRRDVVRSANMGTSCLINQRGDISNKTTYGEASAINVKVHKNDQVTFYARWGDVLGRLSLFMLFLLVARSLVKMIKG